MMPDEINAHLLWQVERGLRFQSVTPRRPILGWVMASLPNSDQATLLAKMASAMRLQSSDCVTLLANQFPADAKPKLAIVLGTSAAADLGLVSDDFSHPAPQVRYSVELGCHYLVTLHPGELLAEPQLKRKAWVDLQVGMMHLGLS